MLKSGAVCRGEPATCAPPRALSPFLFPQQPQPTMLSRQPGTPGTLRPNTVRLRSFTRASHLQALSRAGSRVSAPRYADPRRGSRGCLGCVGTDLAPALALYSQRNPRGGPGLNEHCSPGPRGLGVPSPGTLLPALSLLGSRKAGRGRTNTPSMCPSTSVLRSSLSTQQTLTRPCTKALRYLCSQSPSSCFTSCGFSTRA